MGVLVSMVILIIIQLFTTLAGLTTNEVFDKWIHDRYFYFSIRTYFYPDLRWFESFQTFCSWFFFFSLQNVKKLIIPDVLLKITLRQKIQAMGFVDCKWVNFFLGVRLSWCPPFKLLAFWILRHSKRINTTRVLHKKLRIALIYKTTYSVWFYTTPGKLKLDLVWFFRFLHSASDGKAQLGAN